MIRFLQRAFSYDSSSDEWLSIPRHFQVLTRPRLVDPAAPAYFIATGDHGEIIGGTGLFQVAGEPADEGWVDWFAVDVNSRGRGVGRALLARVLATSKDRGLRTLRLFTSDRPEEASAQWLYESMGLREYRREPEVVLGKLTGFNVVYRSTALGAPVP